MDVLRGVRTLYISTMYIVDNQTVKNMYKPKSLGFLCVVRQREIL